MAENSPPHNAAYDHDPEVNTKSEGDPTAINEAIATPLSNPPMSHKLSTDLYNSIGDLESDLHEYAVQAGLYVIRLQTANLVKDFEPCYVSYACQRGGIRKPRGCGTARATQTTKMDCPLQATAKALAKNDCKWHLEIREGCKKHENHDGDSFNSRLSLSAEMKTFIATFTDCPSISNYEVSTSLRDQFPGVICNERQVRNYRYHLRKQALAGYTPFQATMKLLDDEGVTYTTKWAACSTEESRKPEGLFWTYKWCMDQWAQNYWVQMYDNTYKTNNKNLAFF
jgi:hypothetical protein